MIGLCIEIDGASGVPTVPLVVCPAGATYYEYFHTAYLPVGDTAAATDPCDAMSRAVQAKHLVGKHLVLRTRTAT